MPWEGGVVPRVLLAGVGGDDPVGLRVLTSLGGDLGRWNGVGARADPSVQRNPTGPVAWQGRRAVRRNLGSGIHRVGI